MAEQGSDPLHYSLHRQDVLVGRYSVSGAARAFFAVACVCAASVALLPAAAGAALPGRNGSIAFGTADVSWLGSEEEAWSISTAATGLIDVSGRDRRIVARAGDPAFSPRGRVLALEKGGIVLRPLDERRLIRLTRGPDRFPSWSPSGRRLAFARELPISDYCEWASSHEYRYDSREPCPARLYTVRRDGRDLRVLAARGWHPSWSSKGEIAYEGADGAVWATDSLGRNARRVVDAGRDPDWSPRGDRIAFVRRRGDHVGLFAINRDGTALRRIYVTSSHDLQSPVWSPDGREIAFVADEGLQDDGLYMLSLVSGSRPSKLMGVWCPLCSGTDDETLYGLAWQPLPRPGKPLTQQPATGGRPTASTVASSGYPGNGER
jgi:WD40-like Beta Propeller Repeat